MRIFSYRLRVSTKSPLSWTGMPLARKSKIFGLHSIPANTTPVPLKTAKKAVFATKEFFRRTCRRKNKNGAEIGAKWLILVFRQTDGMRISSYRFFSSRSNRGKAFFQVFENIVDMLCSDGKPDRGGGDSLFFQFRFGQLGVGGGCRVDHQRFHIRHIGK